MADNADKHLAEAVRAALDAVVDPATGKGLVAAGRISGIVASKGRVGFALETDAANAVADESLRREAEVIARGVKGVTAVTAVLTAHSDSRIPSPTPAAAPAQPAPQGKPARTVIAVASAKGGVGKSTVAVNLAAAAARKGLKVGLLDVDIFGPSIPTMMGTVGVKPSLNQRRMIPPFVHGVHTMSIGYLVEPDKAVVWRGPMVASAVMQLVTDTDWGDLDILFVDTPPGTGEVQLTLAQRLPIDGAIIVSTPQEVALADVRRGVALFGKTAVPVMGIIENMAWFELPDGTRADIFGTGGAERTADELGVPFLGALPILPALRIAGDAGAPVKDGPAAQAFDLIADAVIAASSSAIGNPPPRIIFE